MGKKRSAGPAVAFKCEFCGKDYFTSRAAARKAARDRHPGDSQTAYVCRETPEGMPERWHFGHLPYHVKERGFPRNTQWLYSQTKT